MQRQRDAAAVFDGPVLVSVGPVCEGSDHMSRVYDPDLADAVAVT